MHIAAVHSAHQRQHTVYGTGSNLDRERTDFVKKELNVADTDTSLIIKTQNCVIIASTKIFYIYI